MRVGCGSIVLLMGTYNPEDAHLIKVSLQTEDWSWKEVYYIVCMNVCTHPCYYM